MGRKVTPTRQSRRNTFTVCRLGASEWQMWTEPDGGAWEMTMHGATLADLKPSEGVLIALPVRRVFSLAMWVPSADPEIFGDLVFTQLELRGLTFRERSETVFAWREIATEGEETLLQVVALPLNLSSDYWVGDVTDYTVSAACLPLVENSVMLWREGGGWVAAVMRGDKLLHFQPLIEEEPGAEMALEVWMMLTPLEAGNMLCGQVGVVLYHEDGEVPDISAWKSSGGLPIEVKSMPPPKRPPEDLKFIPLPVREVQASKAAAAKTQKILMIVAAAYFVFVLLFSVNTLRLSLKSRSLQRQIDRDAGAVEETSRTMKQWEDLSLATDPLRFPLEVLYQIANLLPKDGVRITLFEMNPGRIIVQGEASTFPAAQRFQDEVKRNEELAAFNWTAENPKSLPNGSARFQIDGVRSGADPDENYESNESADF